MDDLTARVTALEAEVAALRERLEAAWGGEREPDHNSVLRKDVRALQRQVLDLGDGLVSQALEIRALRQRLEGNSEGGPN